MAAPGDTVSPRFDTFGVFLRRPLIFGTVVSGGGAGATQVLWADGKFADLANDTELAVIGNAQPSTISLLGKYVRIVSIPATGQRNEGVVVAAFTANGAEMVAVETVLGLLFVVNINQVQLVPTR